MAHTRLGGMRTERQDGGRHAKTRGERRKTRKAQTQFTEFHDAPLTLATSPDGRAALQNAHNREAYEIAVTPPLKPPPTCADSLHKPLKTRRSGEGGCAASAEMSFKSLIFWG